MNSLFNVFLKMNSQIKKIEELLMIIPSQICRNMNKNFVNLILKDFSKDIAKHHFMILKIIKEHKKLYITEIVQNLGITKSQMTNSVDKLLKLGYLERHSDLKDRRKSFLSLTEEGLSKTEKIIFQIKKNIAKDMKVLSQKELNDLEKGLEVLNKFCSLNKKN